MWLAQPCQVNFELENRSKSGKHKEFVEAVRQAEAVSDVRDVAIISQHAKKNWQASAWRLERKRPDQWGRKERLEVSGDQAAPLVVQVVWPEDDIESVEEESDDDL